MELRSQSMEGHPLRSFSKLMLSNSTLVPKGIVEESRNTQMLNSNVYDSTIFS
jgi:hypothetical protein